MSVNIGDTIVSALAKVRCAEIVDFGALDSNISLIKRKIGAKTLLLAVVKANAYGLGATPIARHIEPCVDYFGVALVEEGVKLRKCGITKPILILGVSQTCQINTIINYDLMPTVCALAFAKALSVSAITALKIVKIHIALDTGMSRIGCNPTTQINDIISISRLPLIKIEGIFSHLSCADSVDQSYTKMQLEKFKTCVTNLALLDIVIPLRHIANSAAIVSGDKSGNMARAGIIMYGMYPSPNTTNFGLTNVASLVSHIAYIHTIAKGASVSYGAEKIVERDTLVAVVPVGYADGYPRAYYKNGCVIINGKFAKILGRICMDQFMVDVSDIDNVAEGDLVTLIGKDGDCAITIEEVAASANSFNYEQATRISQRAPRLYCENGCVVDYLIN